MIRYDKCHRMGLEDAGKKCDGLPHPKNNNQKYRGSSTDSRRSPYFHPFYIHHDYSRQVLPFLLLRLLLLLPYYCCPNGYDY